MIDANTTNWRKKHLMQVHNIKHSKKINKMILAVTQFIVQSC